MFFILILSAPGAGTFSVDFTTNLAQQCRAFSMASKIKKLKAPLFRGPEGAGLQMTGALFRTSSNFFLWSVRTFSLVNSDLFYGSIRTIQVVNSNSFHKSS